MRMKVRMQPQRNLRTWLTRNLCVVACRWVSAAQGPGQPASRSRQLHHSYVDHVISPPYHTGLSHKLVCAVRVRSVRVPWQGCMR